ncbi:P2X receptor C [Diplonema papillatum]|nr:P2X receptor C [Diplonema papillatum]
MRYSMSVKALQGIEFFFEEPLYTTTAGGQLVREVWKRHGLRIVSVASGHVVRFAFAELMKTLVIGMGLMKVASVVVELLIMLLPVSGVYKRYRDVKTIDFSDFDKDKVRDMHDLHFALGEVRTGGPLDPLEEMQLHRVDVPKPSFTKFGDTFNGYNRRASAEGQPGNGKANSSRNNSPSSAVNPKLNQPLLASSLDSRKPSSTTIHATSFLVVGCFFPGTWWCGVPTGAHRVSLNKGRQVSLGTKASTISGLPDIHPLLLRYLWWCGTSAFEQEALVESQGQRFLLSTGILPPQVREAGQLWWP